MAISTPLPTRNFTGIPVAMASPEIVISWILMEASGKSQMGRDIHLLELNGVATAHSSTDFAQVLQNSSLVVADGRWLEFFTRFSSRPLFQLRGEDLFRGVLDRGQLAGLRHYWVGATADVVDSLTAAVKAQNPRIIVAGNYCPPFREMAEDEIAQLAEDVRRVDANVVWVGISTPRQDYLAAKLARETGCVVVAVGAAFSFVSGTITRAPQWMVAIGLEWLYRLMSEPRRLWKRYVLGGVLFLWHVLRYRNID